jgi:hypothetical protein
MRPLRRQTFVVMLADLTTPPWQENTMELPRIDGLIELDATEMATVNGGEDIILTFTPKPDDIWTWLVETICGPMKLDDAQLMV